VAGHIYPWPYGATQPLYRYWSASSGDHYYTRGHYPNGLCYGSCYTYEGALGFVLP
jgi:hypothetical protein